MSRTLIAAAWLAAAVIALFVLAIGMMLVQEHDGVNRARLTRARADINALETAAQIFHLKYGAYPARIWTVPPQTLREKYKIDQISSDDNLQRRANY